MAYGTLSDSQIDGDSPLIADTLFKLRDNPIAIANGDPGAPRIQTAGINDQAVTNAKIADWTIGPYKNAGASIKQYALDTSEGSVLVNGDGGGGDAAITLPGGQYGFYPQLAQTGNTNAGANNWLAQIIGYGPLGEGSGIATARTTYFSLVNNISSTYTPDPTATVYQRYINSSPPYNLGDGGVPLFVFVKIRADGKMGGIYVADVPPWAYNGPTRVTTDRICKLSNRNMQTVRKFNRETGEIDVFEREVCDAVKNTDMPLIPHPFISMQPGERVVLLEPCATEKLHEIHLAGESIAGLLFDDYLRLGNDLRCASSPGVTPVSFRFRNSRVSF